MVTSQRKTLENSMFYKAATQKIFKNPINNKWRTMNDIFNNVSKHNTKLMEIIDTTKDT